MTGLTYFFFFFGVLKLKCILFASVLSTLPCMVLILQPCIEAGSLGQVSESRRRKQEGGFLID